MSERALSELRKDCIAALAMLAVATLLGGIVSLLHGWVV